MKYQREILKTACKLYCLNIVQYTYLLIMEIVIKIQQLLCVLKENVSSQI